MEFLGPGTGEPDASTSFRVDILILMKRFESDAGRSLIWPLFPTSCMTTPSTVCDSCGVWFSGSFCAAAKAANAYTKESALIIFETIYSAANGPFRFGAADDRVALLERWRKEVVGGEAKEFFLKLLRA